MRKLESKWNSVMLDFVDFDNTSDFQTYWTWSDDIDGVDIAILTDKPIKALKVLIINVGNEYLYAYPRTSGFNLDCKFIVENKSTKYFIPLNDDISYCSLNESREHGFFTNIQISIGDSILQTIEERYGIQILSAKTLMEYMTNGTGKLQVQYIKTDEFLQFQEI